MGARLWDLWEGRSWLQAGSAMPGACGAEECHREIRQVVVLIDSRGPRLATKSLQVKVGIHESWTTDATSLQTARQAASLGSGS